MGFAHDRAVRMLLLLFVLAPLSASGAQMVTDEMLRIQALAAIFPNTSVKVLRGKRLDNSDTSAESPDALKDEKVYEIAGPPSGEDEQCASDDVLNPGSRSPIREVRFEMFRVAQASYAVVVQYNFPKANPAMACPSIARVLLLENENGRFKTIAARDLETVHHWDIEMIRFARLQGTAAQQLIVESDAGGAGTRLVELYIFDFSSRHITQLFSTDAYAYAALYKVDSFRLALDIPRTQAQNGEHFCFTKTTYIDQDRAFTPPHVTHPCYKPDRE